MYEKKHDEQIKGGCGRSPESLACDSWNLIMALVGLVLFLIAMIAEKYI